MRNMIFVVFGSAALMATAAQCSNGPADCTQTSTCLSDASDGPAPLVCDMTKDPKDAPGCLDNRVGIFVSPTGSDTNAGTKAAPVQTIGHALTLVGTLTRLYVCEGTYAEDVALGPPTADGISLYAGFKCADWTYSGTKAQIGKTNFPLKITGTTKPVAIQDFLVVAADGFAGSSSSIAALVANAAAVTFARVNLTAGKGLPGTDGVTATNYDTTVLPASVKIKGNSATGGGTSYGAAQLCTGLCTDGNLPTGGAGGQGGTSTQGGASGAAKPAIVGTFPNDGAGGNGGAVCTIGDHGANATIVGADAISPTTLGTLTPTGWTAAAGATGSNGGSGEGGGGGGGNTYADNTAGGGGGGACGGCGGAGGAAGATGGSSVALAVIASMVVINASELHAGDAGNGGKGVVGQGGQAGGVFGSGSPPGCNGGSGGNGSAGGAGAGGIGGISVGVLYKGAAPTVDQTTTGATTLGKAGTHGVGGKAGTNDGIDGLAQATFQSP